MKPFEPKRPRNEGVGKLHPYEPYDPKFPIFFVNCTISFIFVVNMC